MKETQETWVPSLGWEDPLEEERATHSSILAWRIPWTEEPGGVHSMRLGRVGHDWATGHMHITHTGTFCLSFNTYFNQSMPFLAFSPPVSSTILDSQKERGTNITWMKTATQENGRAVWLHSPPHAVAPPEGGAGAGAGAAAPAGEKSGWRSRRSLDGFEVLKGKYHFTIRFLKF